jgi:hypothetical protein
VSILRATVTGNLREFLADELRATQDAMRRGVTAAGREVQADLRQRTQAAGLGRNLSNAWRLEVYPPVTRRTLRPAALVYSQAPEIMEGHSEGPRITVKTAGRKWLAFPTGYNAAGGRRNAGGRGGVRVTPAQMVAAKKEAFIIRSKSNPDVYLWCLRIRQASGISRRSRRIRLFVAGNVEVATGKGGGGRAKRAERVKQLTEQGFVAMFFLMKSVKLRKRVDVAAVRSAAEGVLARSVASSLGSAR